MAALALAACGGDERTVETIPIPQVVDACLDELQAPGEAQSLFETDAENIRLCVVLQGLDCVLIEPLCTTGERCPAPAWSCPNPGLELEEGDVLDANLFIVDESAGDMACADVMLGDAPTCAGPNCLARINYQLEYTASDDEPLRISETPVRIFHSGYLSEEVGTFSSGPASICSPISDFTCEGDGCGEPIQLNIALGGSGAGAVNLESAAQALRCEENICPVVLPSGRSITLTATAATGSVFGDWGDACAAEQRGLTCTLQPTGSTVVSARFGYRLELEILGEGTVRSNDGGLDGDGIICVSDEAGTTCQEDYVTDQRRVTLTAEGSPEWPFSRWTGCEDVTDGVCTVTMDQARTVRATFGRQVSVNVVGGGRVVITPGDLPCTGRCAFAFAPGEQVSLQATANANSTRYDWLDACAAEGTDVCDLGALDANVTVTARFGYDVTTSVNAAQGAIDRTEGEASIACGNNDPSCRSFLPGTQVTYTAVAADDPAHAFTQWQGLCADAMSNPDCNLTIGVPGTVTANFDRAVRVGVTVDNDGQSSGSVVRNPEPNAMNCSADCSDRYLQSTGTVQLTANSPTGTRFMGWSVTGGGEPCAASATAPDCTVDVSDGVDRVLQARFVSEQTVTVNFVGEGTGTITPVADPPSPNWSCAGTRCTGDFLVGQTVTLEAQTAGNNRLETFRSSALSCSGPTCSFVVGDVDLIEADFEVERVLRVTFDGGGAGSIVLPASFDQASPLTCTTDCSRTYLSGRSFTLVAERPVNVVFERWQGCNTATGISCQVTMDSDPKSLTARFLPPRRLDLQLLGTGAARVEVTGDGNPVTCSGTPPVTCPTLAYPANTMVTLTVPALTGTTFDTWGGACNGVQQPVCTIQMDVDRSVTATFEQRTYDVTVNFGGAAAASGVVAWVTPTRPNCSGPNACTESVNEGSTVALRPIGGAGYQFDSWTGCDQVVNGDECRLNNLTANRTVRADFVPLSGVQVTLAGSGTGRIIWDSPVRPDCERSAPATCPVESVVQNTTVELRAQPANTDTQFVGWTVCPAINGDECTIASVGAAESVTAEFVALHDVAINLAGDGNGRVEWTSPTFPDCVPGTCPTRSVQQGTTVTLTAETVTGSTFTGWSGCDAVSGTNNEICTLTSVSADRNPSAEYFDDRTITVRMRGAGDAGIDFSVGGSVVDNCPVTPVEYDCTKTFPYTSGTVVLTANASATTTFTGWASGCTGVGTCLVDVQTAFTHVRRANFTN